MGTSTRDLRASAAAASGLQQDRQLLSERPAFNGDFTLLDSQSTSSPSETLDFGASSLSPPVEVQRDRLLAQEPAVYGDFNGEFSFVESPPLVSLSPSDFLDLPPSPALPPTVAHSPTLNLASSLISPTGPDSADDPRLFSSIVIANICQMLMEDETDAGVAQFPESSALLAAEQPFLEILRDNSSLPPDQPPLPSAHSSDSPKNTSSYGSCSDFNGVTPGGVAAIENSCPYDHISFSSMNSTNDLVQGFEESLLSTVAVSDLLTQSEPALQFRRGLEEAQKFLPGDEKLVVDLEACGFSFPLHESQEESIPAEFKPEAEHGVHRGQKNSHSGDLDLEEGRSNKQNAVQSAVPLEEAVRQMFDKVLLANGGDLCGYSITEQRESSHDNEAAKEPQNIKGKGKGQQRKQSGGAVDLWTLLNYCAQAVATDDKRSANELLRQIRQHSSSTGDANQRLAHCFVDGLEARLAGTGSQIYRSILARQTPTVDVLNAYQLYMAACPFKKISYIFSNQTIMNAAKKTTKVHIIDYGIAYGFQWPCLLQSLAKRPGGPPKLRITGIDLPQSGFRPAERIEDTGRRLAYYAQRFNVPFEFQAIATKWETVQIEDLNLDQDEVLIVNSLQQFKTLLDETVIVDDNPRDKVLNTISKMKPHVFIHGAINGSYNAPLFMTRFREALFFYSALFDMLEVTVPRENGDRMLIEWFLFGRSAVNTITCEGSERIERPETYKQWHMRNLRAGFKQVPLSEDMVNKAREMVQSCYHKDFIVLEDQKWLLQGWKGRIIYANSIWKPT